MKNKIIMLFISIFISLFLFFSNVLAETYNYNLPAVLTNLTEEQLNSIKSLVSSQGINNYFISHTVYTSPNFYVYKVDSLSINSSYKLNYTNCRNFKISNDFSSITINPSGCVNSGNYSLLPAYQTNYIVYSTFDLTYPNNDNTFNYTYIDKTFSQPSSNNLKFYTISDIREWYYTDPHKTLTDFVDLVIDRLSYITSYFCSNYIYLSIFVIFLFYFSILLIRRFI